MRKILTPPEWLTVIFARIMGYIQLGTGVLWMVASPSHTSGAGYKPVDHLLHFLPGRPVLWWSALLIVLAAGALISIGLRRDLASRVFFSLMATYWSFWTILYAVAFLTEPTGGAAAIGLAMIAMVGNVRPVLGLPFIERR